MSHTPAPWSFDATGGEADGWWIGNDESHVCRVFGYRDHPRNLADARLIAAAPDMLEALQEAEAVMTIVPPRNSTAEYLACLKRIRAALAKAGHGRE